MVKEIKVNYKTKQDTIKFSSIPVFKYQRSIAQEVEKGNLTKKKCLELLEQMMMVRALEGMLVEIAAGIYKPLPEFKYVGPTHLSIGQEATSVGSVSALGLDDYITSSHRGHGDAMAKGYNVIKTMNLDSLRKLLEKRKKFASAIGESLK